MGAMFGPFYRRTLKIGLRLPPDDKRDLAVL